MDEQINERMIEKMNGQKNEWKNEWINAHKKQKTTTKKQEVDKERMNKQIYE